MSNGKPKVLEFINNGWIQFENAGGCTNVKNFIEGQLQSFNLLALKNAKDNFCYFRCFVILDSDKEYSTQLDKHSKIKVYLAKRQIAFHILQKRAIENYMPDEVIQDLPTLQKDFRKFNQWVTIYNDLTSQQKDYLNYKSGFAINKSRSEQLPDVQRLFRNLSDTDFTILDQGLNLPKFKDYFPTLFENNYRVHSKTLLKREGGDENSNEFKVILQKINELL